MHSKFQRVVINPACGGVHNTVHVFEVMATCNCSLVTNWGKCELGKEANNGLHRPHQKGYQSRQHRWHYLIT